MNREDRLSPEERELARLLGRAPTVAPPAPVDAAVLAAARAAVQGPAAAVAPAPSTAPDTVGRRPRSRLPAVFGLAASVVFAVGIAWQLKPEPPAPPSAAGAGMETPPPASPARAYTGPATTSASPAAAAAAAPAAPTADPPMAATTPSASTRAPEPARAPAAAQRVRSDAVQAEAVAEVAPVAIAAPPAPAPAPAPVAEAPPSRAAAKQVQAFDNAAPERDSVTVTGAQMQRPVPRPEARSSAAPTAGAAGVMRRQAAPMGAVAAAASDTAGQALQEAVDADAGLPRRQWLKRIRERRDAGDPDTARASLERYLQHYPEVRLPRDLRQLLEN